jgi:peptidoglycan/LPS O-acetylase OafA/YrhL
METLPPALRAGLSRKQLPGLDGIRAIAAFSVVFYHAGVPFVSGGLGVLIFFVLSGFLITWLLLKEDDATGNVSLRDFYIRRSLRIFPAFYAYSGLVLALSLWRHRAILWPQAIASLLYVNNYYQGLHGDPNTGFSHTWSLAIEEQFYLLWPVAFLLLRTNRRKLIWFLAGTIAGVWVYRGVLIFVFNANQGYLYEAFDTRADHLLIGCLLAVVLRTGAVPAFWNWLIAHTWTAALTVAALAASSFAESLYGTGYRDTIGFTLNPLLAALWIAQMIAFSEAGAWRWMNWSWVAYLGKISYSIYLYQQLVVSVPDKLLAGYPMIARVAASAAIVILFASLSHYVIERPFLRLKARFGRPELIPEASRDKSQPFVVPRQLG